MSDFERLLRSMTEGSVDFIIVGGLAAAVHGSARLTQDIDLVYSRAKENIHRLARALEGVNPYPRGAPPGLPFRWDRETIFRGLNFTLTTTLGDLDLLGEIAGGGGYDDLMRHTVEVEIFGLRCKCLDLPTLIRVKRAAGRPRDFEAVAELEALLDERDRGKSG